MELNHIEEYFKQQEKLMGNLADEDAFAIIFDLIDTVRLLESQTDRLCALNRHYLNHFYGGSVLKMQEDFKYINEQFGQ